MAYELTPAMEIAMAYRVPVFRRRDDPQAISNAAKIDMLEEWTLVSANLGGDLAQERLEAHVELARVSLEWEKLEGWEPFRQGKTDASVDRAKASLRPDLSEKMRELRWRVDRLTEEIDRFDSEYAKVSRAYTMISGA